MFPFPQPLLAFATVSASIVSACSCDDVRWWIAGSSGGGRRWLYREQRAALDVRCHASIRTLQRWVLRSRLRTDRWLSGDVLPNEGAIFRELSTYFRALPGVHRDRDKTKECMLKANKKGTGSECRKIINFVSLLFSSSVCFRRRATEAMSLILLLLTLLALNRFRWSFVDDSTWT